MAAIHELLSQVQDEALRARLEQEINKLSKTKKFGLVFEEHLPECTPLYDIPVKRGALVAKKSGAVNEMYEVHFINDGIAKCYHKVTEKKEEIPVDELVCVAEFGEPIYPYLKQVDSIYNSDDKELPTHALIQADNYHALQLLEYLYAGKVDCIYIDPPYNTGARDWKYNNDYVDSADTYRHSKWLSMMKKRLLLAKRLLNPADSVLIVTIDEKEYLHLGCLLEELFPEANIQMISSVIAHHGTSRNNELSRINEFIYFVMIGDYTLNPLGESGYVKEGEEIHWQSFRRSNPSNTRPTRPSQFYPIYINRENHRIQYIGDPITPNIDRHSVEQIPGCDIVFPVKDDGIEMMWSLTPEIARINAEKGYVRIGKYSPEKPQQYILQYLMSGTIKEIENGSVEIMGYANDGSIIARNKETKKSLPKSQWDYMTHDARSHGTKLLKGILGDLRFSFPKSLYAVKDCLSIFVANKPNALIVDFFAGSGTTLHAVNLLNAEDGGKRQCIMVTNNEVSDDEAKQLRAKGFNPGDAEWEKLGIANYVTWPRTVCSINGKDINGNDLKGNYIGSDIPMADGFKANAVFFKLGFLEKTSVQLGRQFKEMLPMLWLKAGGWGKCPTAEVVSTGSTTGSSLPRYIILPENRFAVLIDENYFSEFAEKVHEKPEIQTAYLITDFEKGFKAMTNSLNIGKTYQLYRDYLDNFRINIER